MADMKLALRKEGGKIRRWDYETGEWVLWKGGVFTSPNMMGRYKLSIKAKKWVLERISFRGVSQWEIAVPEGISAFHAMERGGNVVLPWEEEDPYIRVCRMCGLEAKQVIFQPANVMEITIALAEKKTPDGIKYREWFVSDGMQTQSDEGIRVQLPGYILEIDIYAPAVPGKPEVKYATRVHIWKDKKLGTPISPANLLKAVNAQGLRNTMTQWETSLYREHLDKLKELKQKEKEA